MKRNFTLIEVLTAMVLMAILAGIIVAGAGYAARRGDETSTIVTMQKFHAALDKFVEANGYYPPSFVRAYSTTASEADNTETEPKRVMLLVDSDGNLELMLFNEGDATADRPYFMLYSKDEDGNNANYIQDYDVPGGDWSDARCLEDAWGNPIWYECPGQINTSGYDLWSCGPKGEQMPSDPRNSGDSAEWLCNWTAVR